MPLTLNFMLQGDKPSVVLRDARAKLSHDPTNPISLSFRFGSDVCQVEVGDASSRFQTIFDSSQNFSALDQGSDQKIVVHGTRTNL